MTPSASVSAFIKGYESCHLKGYLPTAHDVPTIGWGSTGPDVFIGQVWTQEQANKRFDSDLRRFGLSLSTALGAAPTSQCQYDAMVSLSYNIGMGSFAKSTLLKRHKEGNYAAAAMEFAKWDKQAGETLAGLTKRRAAESRMYRGLPV